MKIALQNKQKVRDWLVRGLTLTVGIMVVVAFWLVYSLIRFDGFFSPTYILGLSDPYKYYQKHIGSLLAQHGKEYAIDGVDTKNWKLYKDTRDGFEFKYPSELVAEDFSQDEYRKSIYFLDGVDKDEQDPICEIDVEFRGWKLGKHGLPSARRKTASDTIKNRVDELWYIHDQYGGVTGIASTRFFQSSSDNIQFTGVTFIEKKEGVFLHIVNNRNSCEEDMTKGILATFRFTE